MSSNKRAIVSIVYFFVFFSAITSEEPSSGIDGEIMPEEDNLVSDTNDVPYEKRPSGHSFVRFGKSDGPKGHKLMYFGKRESPQERNFVELLQYLQRNPEPSWKRGHSIMRFGKRSPQNKNDFLRFGKRSPQNINDFMRFGKRSPESKHNYIRFGKRDAPNEDYNEEDKRGGHSMMYFGKRNGHSMLYFGKRQPDEEDAPTEYDDYEDLEKKGGHSMMYFGKRMSPEDDMEKKAGHSMMYFGKRIPSDDDIEKKAGHSMMYFGKRKPEDAADRPNKHAMLYFGKRDSSGDDENTDELKNGTDDKRATHSIIRFGKRQISSWLPSSSSFEPMSSRYYAPAASTSRAMGRNSLIDKKKHNMMHFGKKSVDNDYEDHGDDAKIKSNSREK